MGAGLGFLLIVGPSVAQYQMINMATSAMEGQMAEAGEIASMNVCAALMQQATTAPAVAGHDVPSGASGASGADSWQTQAMQMGEVTYLSPGEIDAATALSGGTLGRDRASSVDAQ